MTQLDLISFFSPIFFSFQFFSFCIFMISTSVLFGYLSYFTFFINKIYISYSHIYKLKLVWKYLTTI